MTKTTDDFFEGKALHVTGPNGNPLKVTMRKDMNGRFIATVHGKTGKTLPGGAGKTPKEALARTQKMISGTPKRVKWANEDKLDDFFESSTSSMFWRKVDHTHKSLQDASKFLHKMHRHFTTSSPDMISSKDGQAFLKHLDDTMYAISAAERKVEDFEKEWDRFIDDNL